ncbi:MAG: flagellin [Deltaproteobacteria bacterium]|nr:flagellin [Deltaproteobacteria bacterium]
MSLIVNHNLMAQNAARNLGIVYDRLGASTQRLSSGLRINSAADDAAGLAIREFMRSEIATLNQGIRNASDGISLIQTAEGAMQVIDEKLLRMKELSEQAATGTYTTAQREIMNSEFQAMASEIDRIANATDFNGVKLLDGSLAYQHSGSGMKIHFGAGNDAAEDYYFINTSDMRATASTGLRVGNSDPRDTLRTTGLNALSATSALSEGTGLSTTANDGMFGLRFSNDFDSQDAGSASWTVYGYVDVDASKTSINDIVQNINQGRQATGTITFAAMADTTEMATQSLTINGNIFTFASAAGVGTYDATNKTGVINISAPNISAASLSLEVSAYLNVHNTSIGVNAVYSGSTLNLFATEWGEDGNNIDTTVTGSFTAGQTSLQHGGEKQMTASVFYDEANGQYELQIQMDRGGEKNQVQIFNLNFNGGTSDPQVVGGAITGTSMNGQYGVMYTDDAGTAVNSFNLVDETTEWAQPQNGTGNTDWDGADILTQSAAQRSLAAMNEAIARKDVARANLGAIQNRLENTITNLQIQAENLQASESRISDVDVATEMTEFTRNNILAQAAVSMLAQANSLPQLALSLLG